jgi:hydrogenase nickel incorporation protein HypA/HybF
VHEMGITQGILAASFEAAEEAGATRITVIRVSVGELTEVMDFALQFAFESLTPGTMAEGAVLVVNHVPARAKCLECGNEFEHDRFEMVCPKCGSFALECLTGRELQIDSIETDDPSEGSADTSAADSAGGLAMTSEESD